MSIDFARVSRGVVLTLALLTACTSPPKARVDQDNNANFAGYKTFGWYERKPAETEAAAEPAKVSTIEGQRVRAALSAAMQAKGYILDESQPDVRVGYVLNIYQRPKQGGMRIGVGAGGGSGNMSGGVGMSVPVGPRTETVGAMTVDVIDATRNAQVWTGSYETLMSKNSQDADVKKLIDVILTKYPARPN